MLVELKSGETYNGTFFQYIVFVCLCLGIYMSAFLSLHNRKNINHFCYQYINSYIEKKGRLVNCDAWMNINLRHVICTSKDGTRFWKISECHIRGSSIKYFRLPESIMESAEKIEQRERLEYQQSKQQRGGGSSSSSGRHQQQQRQPFRGGGGGGRGATSDAGVGRGSGRGDRGGSGRGGGGGPSSGRTAGGRGGGGAGRGYVGSRGSSSSGRMDSGRGRIT